MIIIYYTFDEEMFRMYLIIFLYNYNLKTLILFTNFSNKSHKFM